MFYFQIDLQTAIFNALSRVVHIQHSGVHCDRGTIVRRDQIKLKL